MSAFIENNYKEIKITKTREDVKIQKYHQFQLNFKNTKSESMLSTFNKHINKNDVAYVKYSPNAERSKHNIPLKEKFCDNIIVLTPIEKTDIYPT